MKVQLSPRAEADLIRQFRYYLVDHDAPTVAVRFRESLIASIEQLRAYPEMGTKFAGSISGLRSWPVKGFEAIRIYYVNNPGHLVVVRILHGKRSIRQILKREKLDES